MSASLEINGTFPEPSLIFAPNLTSRFIATPAHRRGEKSLSVPNRREEAIGVAGTEVGAAVEHSPEASRRRTDARLEAVGFSLALLFVLGLGALGTWAVVLLVNSLIQAQSLPQSQPLAEPPSSLVQNASWFQR